MRSFEQMADNILRKYDAYLEKKRRRTLILRSLAIGAGAAAVIGIGLTTFALRPPKKPMPDQSGIIVNTETTSAETTAAPTTTGKTTLQTTATQQTVTTVSVTDPQTSATHRTSTATATTNSTTFHTTVTQKTTAATSAATSVTSRQTTTAVFTTVNTAPDTSMVHTTEYYNTTTYYATSYYYTTQVQTSEQYYYVTSAYETTVTTTATTLDIEVYERMIAQNFRELSVNGKTYTRETTVISPEYTDEFMEELTLEPTVYADELPPQITAWAFSVINMDPDKIIAITCDGSYKYRIYKCTEYSAKEIAEYIKYIKDNYT